MLVLYLGSLERMAVHKTRKCLLLSLHLLINMPNVIMVYVINYRVFQYGETSSR